MPEKSLFAGISILDPDESILADNGAFMGKDRRTIDRLLEIGAKTHRHDAHAGLTNPATPMGASAVASGGQIPAGISFSIGYTLEDDQGGETLLSPLVTVATANGITAPTLAPDAEMDYTAGSLLTDTYYYAYSYLDGDGGETPVGPSRPVEREPGFPNGRTLISGLTDGLAGAGAAGWNLYRAVGGGDFHLLATGDTGDDTYIDDGSASVNCDITPLDEINNTTNNNTTLLIQLPSAVQDDAELIDVYVSQDGTFRGDVLLDQYPTASAGATVIYRSIDLIEGSPPAVSTSVGGASKIDPDSEILDWHWKRPVANVGALPTGEGTEEGDTRVVLDTGTIYVYIDGAWQASSGGGGGDGSVDVNLVAQHPGADPISDNFSINNLDENYGGSPLTNTLFDLGVSGGHLVRTADDSPAILGSPGTYNDGADGPLAQIKFHTGAESVTQMPIAAYFYATDLASHVRVEWNDGGILRMVTSDVNSTETERNTDSPPAMTNNTDYWIELRRIGNDIYGNLYDGDPSSASPIGTVTVDLDSDPLESLLGSGAPVYAAIFIGYSEVYTNISWWDDLVFDGDPGGPTGPDATVADASAIDFAAGSGIVLQVVPNGTGRAKVIIGLETP